MWKIIGYAMVGAEAGVLFVLLFEPGGTQFSKISGKVLRSYSEGSSVWHVVLMVIIPALAGAWFGWKSRAGRPKS